MGPTCRAGTWNVGSFRSSTKAGPVGEVPEAVEFPPAVVTRLPCGEAAVTVTVLPATAFCWTEAFCTWLLVPVAPAAFPPFWPVDCV
jgi:hypothetical protein